MKMQQVSSKQHGFVMVIALIMLLAVTLMVVSSSNMVQANLQVVQNVESREHARAAALAAIEEAISSDRFTTDPEAIFVKSSEEPNQRRYDTNGDGRMDITVRVAPPTCAVVTPTLNSDLDVFGSAAQASCFLPPGVYSMCAYSVWDFRATATDDVTGAEVTVRQGVSVLTTLNKIDSSCPA